MVKVSVRYVTKRTNRKGVVRWYWQRPGFPLTRLPDDHVKRYAEAERLNEWADRQRMRGSRAEDSVAALVKLYEQSDRYKDLAPGTRTYYDRKLRDVLKVWADLPASEIDRRAAIDFIESYPQAGERRKARAVLLSLFDVATYRGWTQSNPAHGVRLKTAPKRDQVWSQEALDTFWATLAAMDWPAWKREAVSLYMTLCRYTAQRPGSPTSRRVTCGARRWCGWLRPARRYIKLRRSAATVSKARRRSWRRTCPARQRWRGRRLERGKERSRRWRASILNHENTTLSSACW